MIQVIPELMKMNQQRMEEQSGEKQADEERKMKELFKQNLLSLMGSFHQKYGYTFNVSFSVTRVEKKNGLILFKEDPGQ